MEDLFRVRPGIIDTEVGYQGGDNENPTYKYHPGHAEGIELTYDPEIISFAGVLDYFFRVHDPTTVDQQGNDRGSSYRSTIFYQDDEEKALSEAFIEKVNASKRWPSPAVTTVEAFSPFWPAEPEHQDYLKRIPNGYTCHFERFGAYE